MKSWQFLLPDIGEGTAEGEIVKWYVKEGDSITEDQPMVEVMTDKATVVIPSPKNGKVSRLFGKIGDIIAVHSPLLEIIPADSEVNEEAVSEAEMELESFSPLFEKAPESDSESFDFLLPDIGEGTAEGEIVKWYVKEGDILTEDQPMVEVMTDKATVVIPSPKKGKVTRLFGPVGTIVEVHKPLLSIQILSEPVKNGQSSKKESPAEEKVNSPKITSPVLTGGQVLATPATRKLARNLNVDLTLVSGSGKNGRITDEDVKNAQSGIQKPAVAVPVVSNPKPVQSPVSLQSVSGLIEEIPFAGIRKKIADKMVQSVYTAPHFTYMDEVDVTALVEMREKLKPSAEKEGLKLTYMPFMLKALVEALKRNPICNATLDEAAKVIRVKKYYNIGIGMDTPNGLIVAVLKDLDKKSIFEIARELKDLADRTKSGQIRPDELRDSTFTISNVGAVGGLMATPVINFPEVAIMAPGKIQQRPVVIDGKLEIRWMMYHSWSCDHRVVDGADAVRCGNDFTRFLSQPEWLLVNLR